jgi:hypothetical protein
VSGALGLTTARRRGLATLGAALTIAMGLTVTGTRLAASQEPVLVAMRSAGDVPVREPWDPFWDTVPQTDVALSAQQSTPPMGGRRLTIVARAVNDGENLYVEVEWADPTADRSVGATEDFTDAVAIQFPASGATQVPAFCMGDPTAGVNIWQWRAAWQADIARGFQGRESLLHPNGYVDMYPFQGDDTFVSGRAVGNPFSVLHRSSPVDNLIASGFGSLTADPTPTVTGWGQWRDGVWRVVFERPLSVGREGNVDLAPDDYTDVAFAVWDGAAEERNGRKSVAQFLALDVSPDPLGKEGGQALWPFVYAAIAILWGVFLWVVVSGFRRQRA